MTNSPLALLCTRRLWPITVAQACAALNDNMVRNALVVLAMFRTASVGAGFAAMAGALFMAPYILLSATAGQVADRFSKRAVVIVAKASEAALMAGAAAAFLSGSIDGLLAVLFGLGVQAAVFGPVKFGILAEHLDEAELVAGNGVMECATFVAIVTGTLAGGSLVTEPHGGALVAALGGVLSAVGLAAATFLPATVPAAPGLRIGLNPLAETWRVTREAMSLRPVRLSMLGLSWFWTLGATLVAELPVVVRDTLHADGRTLSALLAVFAVGVGAGSILCSRLLKGEVSARHVPFAALGLSAFLADFAVASSHLGGLGIHHAADLLSSVQGVRALADLLLLSACGGVFSVPLYAIMQESSPQDRRSRTFAANNVLNGVAMVFGAAVVAAMESSGAGPMAVLGVASAANLAAAAWIFRILPQTTYRAIVRWYFETLHGVEVSGLENYRAAGDRVVIVSNHTSYLDASLIAAFLPDSPVFAIHSKQMEKWWVRLATSAVSTFPVDLQNPYAIKGMVESVRDRGQKLMIFPEGRLTKTGALMKVYEGAGLVADKSSAKVVSVSIDGLQFSPLGHMRGKLNLRWFPPLRLTVHPAVDLTPATTEDLTPRRRRELVGRALQDLMVDSAYRSADVDKSLFAALLDARDIHGGKTVIAEDVTREPIDYDRLVLGAVALGRALAPRPGRAAVSLPATGDEDGQAVALMLPNTVPTLVAFFGLQAFGRVPAMLNFSAGADAMLTACKAARASRVVSSRKFVEKGKLGQVVERMQAGSEGLPGVEFVWLEDVKGSIGLCAKLRAKLDASRARSLPGASAAAGGRAAILFTSGSEGTPKGVVLSHGNILSNCAQLRSVVDFNSSDIVMNAMPCFHSIGLCDGTLLPVLNGVRTFLYPSPLHYRVVPALVYDTDATIVFATDTFLNGWAKYANPYDFYKTRYVFAGAEKVKDETKRLFAERFGVRVLEGYGVTETAPVLAINTAKHNRAGTVGRFLPGIEHRLEAAEGIEGGGRLFVRGPNVMLGYMRAEAPGVLESVADGWYDTGDIVSVDADGFVTILARAKRFAKIAGEMVSMLAAETLVSAVWPDDRHAVVKLPDARKGERLVLLTTRRGADGRELLAHARTKGTPELAVPRDVMEIEAIPLLGSGKTDYPAAQRIADERAAVAAPHDEAA
jgi:acyl-[acyl-carrier-protein]-phospholipid O-acyltransferase/long-chain-fatty-acid--[acyl-carrier-protein] ligase